MSGRSAIIAVRLILQQTETRKYLSLTIPFAAKASFVIAADVVAAFTNFTNPLQSRASARYQTWKLSIRMVLQARDLWEEARSGESGAGLREEGMEGLGNHCTGPVCGGERAHHRVHL